MKRGADRFEVGEVAKEQLFPEGAGFPRGIRPGTVLAQHPDAAAFAFEAGGWRMVLPMEDPSGKQRLLDVRLHVQHGIVHTVGARLTSDDRMDVDAGWNQIKPHLEAVHGKPDKEVQGVLRLLFKHAGPNPAVTSISRYRDEHGKNVLDINLRLQDGVTLQVPQQRSGA